MSKITPKNLQYDSTLPPFLARLQANQSSRDGRHEFAIARPKKPRNAEEDAEDEPVVFDEVSGESLTRKQWEERDQEESKDKDKDKDKDEDENAEKEKEEASERTREKIAEIGGVKKRKAGKIIGGGDEEEEDDEEEGRAAKKVGNKAGDKKVDHGSTNTDKGSTKSDGKKVEKGGKSSKKGKKIKLSFGDDE